MLLIIFGQEEIGEIYVMVYFCTIIIEKQL